MEFENSHQALFNSSTEFLVTFDSADDTKPEDQGRSCAVSGQEVAGNETPFAAGQPVKAAGSEQIICEFSDGDTDRFAARDAGAGETANVGVGDAWMSLTSCATPDILTDTHESSASTVLTAGDEGSELGTDRKSEYVKHSVDVPSEFSVTDDNARDLTELELIDTSDCMPSDRGPSQALQLPVSIFPADQHFTSERSSIEQDSDIFSEFGAVCYTATPDQTSVMDTDCKKLDDAENSQNMQLFDPFSDSDKFSPQFSDFEHNSVEQIGDNFADFGANSYTASENVDTTQMSMVGRDCKKLDNADDTQCVQNLFPDCDEFSRQVNDTSVPVPTADQQLVEFNDRVWLGKHETNTSLPDVHRSAINKELISEFPDQLFSEETSSDTTAPTSELTQPAVDANAAITIDDIQVNLLVLCEYSKF